MSVRDADPDERHSGGATEHTGWTDQCWRSGADLLVLALVGVALWTTAGVPGVAVTLLLAIVWIVLPNPAVFVVGQAAVAAFVPAEASAVSTALPAAALCGLLLTTTVTDSRLRDATAVVVALALVGTVAVATHSLAGAQWLTALAVLVASATGFVSLDLIALSEFGENR